MLNMYTCTFRLWMGDCSICIPAHSDSGWVNAQYLYLIIQTVEGWMLNMYGGWVNAQYVFMHIQTMDG